MRQRRFLICFERMNGSDSSEVGRSRLRWVEILRELERTKRAKREKMQERARRKIPTEISDNTFLQLSKNVGEPMLERFWAA